MPTPFPGMNPYLEQQRLWPAFHKQFIAAAYQVLLPGLVDRYRARISARKYTSELVLFTSVTREEHIEEYIEIRSRIDGRLITLLDIVSIGNRTTTGGQTAYLATRQIAYTEKANIVEIDLLTQGKPPVTMDRSKVVDPYCAVTVTRGTSPERHEIYTGAVQKRLPKFKLPLAADDRDTVQDLQVMFQRAYELGNFDTQIDLTQPLPADVKLPQDDRDWIEEELRK
jgi:Protein of unknown function (DUF4058)